MAHKVKKTKETVGDYLNRKVMIENESAAYIMNVIARDKAQKELDTMNERLEGDVEFIRHLINRINPYRMEALLKTFGEEYKDVDDIKFNKVKQEFEALAKLKRTLGDILS